MEHLRSKGYVINVMVFLSPKPTHGLPFWSAMSTLQPPEGWKGGVGFVSKEMIKEHCPAPASDIQV